VQLKLDAWVLPFLNIFTTVGWFDGDATVPIALEGEDLRGFLGLGNLCTGGAREPSICSTTLTSTASPKYRGYNTTIGSNMAAGWRHFFVALPISYTWAFVNILDDPVEALNISPRILKGLQLGVLKYNSSGFLPIFPILNFGLGGDPEEDP
jgi:hypothetical protein